MARHKRERVERGLYKVGRSFEACAQDPVTRRPRWKWLGEIGIGRARTERDKWAVLVRTGGAPQVDADSSFKEVADLVIAKLDRLVEDEEMAPRTRDGYRGEIRNHAIPFFGPRPIASIDADDIAAWVRAQQRSGAADWTIRARWTAMRAVFSHAARHGWIPASPADVLERRERPRHGRSRLRFLDDAEIEGLLAHSGAGVKELYRAVKLRDHYARTTRAAIGLMTFCGLRVSEALGLAPDEVDFDGGHVKVRYQLSRDGRRVPIKTDRHSDAGRRDVVMMTALAKLLRGVVLALPPGSETLLATPYGRPIEYRHGLLDPFHAARTAAGLGDDVTPHALRHTFASILIDRGRPVEYVAQQLGHANTTTTWDTYVHLFRKREQADAARRDLDKGYGSMLG